MIVPPNWIRPQFCRKLELLGKPENARTFSDAPELDSAEGVGTAVARVALGRIQGLRIGDVS
jgi:hypothetical protein